MTAPTEVSQLLRAWSDGEKAAADRLMPLVYEELRQIARRQMRRQRAGHTLQTTALIHEAYLRLVGESDAPWQNRAHFFGVAAKAMRHILVDHARERQALKRGGERQRVDLDANALAVEDQSQEVLDLDEALVALARIDGRLAQVVECRFFGGLTEEETAEALGVTARTVRRDWTKAKALLYARLNA